jgi:hypothetical protein
MTYGGEQVAAGWFLGLLPAVMVGGADAMRDVFAQEQAGGIGAGWPDSVRE